MQDSVTSLQHHASVIGSGQSALVPCCPRRSQHGVRGQRNVGISPGEWRRPARDTPEGSQLGGISLGRAQNARAVEFRGHEVSGGPWMATCLTSDRRARVGAVKLLRVPVTESCCFVQIPSNLSLSVSRVGCLPVSELIAVRVGCII